MSRKCWFRLHGITCCQIIWFFRTQSNCGRSSKSLDALVRPCHIHLNHLQKITHSDVTQVAFVWLVICSRSSRWTRIDGSPLGRIIELHFHALCDHEYFSSSCIYLCRPLYYLVSGLPLWRQFWIYMILYASTIGVCWYVALPLYIPYFGSDLFLESSSMFGR